MFLNEFPTNQPETRQRLVEAEDSMLKYFVVPLLLIWLVLLLVLVVASFFTTDTNQIETQPQQKIETQVVE